LALHVVIGGIGHQRIARRLPRGIAEPGNGVTGAARAGRVPRGLEVGPGTRVLRQLPLALDADVAVAARRLLRADREVPEETVDRVGWGIEGLAVAVDDFLVRTGAERDNGDDSDDQMTQLHGPNSLDLNGVRSIAGITGCPTSASR